MGKYLGFTEGQMINNLGQDADVFKLEVIGKEEGFPVFRIYTFSEEFGEFEADGPLLGILGQASKPFRERWVSSNQEIRRKLKNSLKLGK